MNAGSASDAPCRNSAFAEFRQVRSPALFGRSLETTAVTPN
jgi:hypothetical protein